MARISIPGSKSVYHRVWVALVLVQAPLPLFAQPPTIQWTQQFGSSGDDRGVGTAVDASGNVYIAGNAGDALPGQTHSGGQDAFLRKFDASGNEIWTQQFGTGGADFGFGVAVDASGVYVAGTASGALPLQTHAGGFDAFLRKYDADGNELWTDQFGSSALDFALGVAVDTSGVYVAGTTFGTLPGQSGAGSQDSFVRKYDASGNEVWTRQFGTSGADSTRPIAVDSSGVYVAGFTGGTFPGQTNLGGSDCFVRKYDTDGSEVWTRQFGTPGNGDGGSGIAVDASGVYVSGDANGSLPGQTNLGGFDAFVRKYDTAGNELWTNQFGTSADDSGFGIAVNDSGAYVTGSTNGELPGQTASGGPDGYVRKYDADGNEVWTIQFGTNALDNSIGIAVTASAAYGTGNTAGTFPGEASAGSDDAFLVKLEDMANDPPDCDLAQASPGNLWPPNHNLIPVAIVGVTDPNSDTLMISITGVTQDEPTNGQGDGDTSPDAILQGDTVLVRAECSGGGNGRVYRVQFTADDGEGGLCSGAATVGVPPNMMPGNGPIDDGQLYDSTQP